MFNKKEIALVVRDTQPHKDLGGDEKISASCSWDLMTARHIQSLLKDDPEIRKALFRDPETGAHYNFVQKHMRDGHVTIDAHFAYAAGHAPPESHIFDKNETPYKNIKEALDDGAKIILSFNLDLSHRDLDFSDTQDKDVQSLDDWKSKNKYHSVPIRKIEEAIRVIHQVSKLGGNPDTDIVGSSRNAVMPYRRVYLGRRDEDFKTLYNNLVAGEIGVPVGATRQLGFPVIMRFDATQTTMKYQGAKGIKGNKIDLETGQSLLSYIVFSERSAMQKNVAMQEALSKLSQGARSVYLLVCPTVSRGPKVDSGRWQNLRLIVNSSEDQIISVPKEYAQKIAVSNKMAAPV